MNNLSKDETQTIMVQPELVSVLTELVAQLKKPQISADDELWSNSNIADYLQLSLDSVERHVITRPDFPKALQPCPTGKRAAKRWFAGDIIRWARQNKGELPKPRAKANQSKRPAISEAVAL